MLRRLPYRVQVPLGLALAVIVTALLVSALSTRVSARAAREEKIATVNSAMTLLSVQARPLLAAEDTWRTFTLLRDTAALLPGSDTGHGRAAILDNRGRIIAGSDPAVLGTARPVLGESFHGRLLPRPAELVARAAIQSPDDSMALIDPIRSEDGQVLGYSFAEIDARVFEPDWGATATPALIGAFLAVIFLVPIGWLTGRRMARPVAQIADCIARIGHSSAEQLQAEVPRDEDPELNRIGDAVRQLLGEMKVRQQAERRALSAERMAAVGRITAAVAHEINNPLGGLLNAARTLKLHGESGPTRERALDLIERGLQQIRTTVAALLPHGRIDDRRLEVADLDDTATLVRAAAESAGVEVAASAEVTSALRVPSSVMRQVMLNLLLNAIKAAGERGWVKAALEADIDVVRLTVTNSGARLAPDALERSIASEQGNDPRGFGLWVCREIATQFGGGFEASDNAEAATCLVFWIPNRGSHDVATVD